MAEKNKSKKSSEEKVKKREGKRKSKDETKEKQKLGATAKAVSLLADEGAVDPALSSLFAAQPTPPVRGSRVSVTSLIANRRDVEPDESITDDDDDDDVDADEDFELNDRSEEQMLKVGLQEKSDSVVRDKRKRKRKDEEDDLEDVYMQRIAREEAKDSQALAAERSNKRLKNVQGTQDEEEDTGVSDGDEDAGDDEHATVEGDDDVQSPPPKHETEAAADDELEKANRTVFLGNVSTAAIASKNNRKVLLTHLKSFFSALSAPKDGEPKHALESIRFRSTPYASPGPKKAAFAKKELMDATTKSTNAYAVYSSQALAREAAKRLNGTVVLDRHLRVDEVAHPSKIESKRCVFVGNLGFVDDESNIQKADEAEGKEKRKPAKEPADIEEGLWRSFGKCGNVESVRVIRDSQTRVSKGVAYVQFDHENAVEAALLYEGKKFPPMLPRKLRVTRARAPKRNVKPGSGRPSVTSNNSNGGGPGGYRRKITGSEASQIGRAGKLYGRAGAAQVRRSGNRGPPPAVATANGLRKPESFVFEGHRASSKGGNTGLKLGGNKRGKKAGGKPTNRSAKRGAAYKAAQKNDD